MSEIDQDAGLDSIDGVVPSGVQVTDAKRRLFDTVAYVLSYYGTPSDQLLDSFIVDELTQQVQQLSVLDPYLQILLDKNLLNQDNGCYKIGVGILEEPHPKLLNDKYFGETGTDAFIADLHTLIKQHFGEDIDVLSVDFKVVHFLVDMNNQHFATDNNQDKLVLLRKYLKDFQGQVRNLLILHISKTIKTLEQDQLQLTNIADQNVVEDRRLKVDNRLHALESLKSRLEQNALREDNYELVRVTFGLNSISKDMNLFEQFISIINAERAARMASLRRYSNLKQRRTFEQRGILQEFSYEYFFIDILRNYIKFLEIFDNTSGTPCIKDEWKDFFIFDERTNMIVMQKDKVDQLRKKREFDIDDEYHYFFQDYYSMVQLMDVLKNFTAQSFPIYMERLFNLRDLILEAQKELEKPVKDYDKLRALLARTTGELEISIKDKGQEIASTQRVMIKALLEGGNKLIVMMDHIGFGLNNIEGYQSNLFNLIHLFGLTQNEWQELQQLIATGGGQDQIFSIVQSKLHTIFADEERSMNFLNTLFAVGDHGTTYLDDVLSHVSEILNTRIVRGGDELKCILTTMPDGCKITDAKLDEIHELLTKISQSFNIRIAAVLTDLTIDCNGLQGDQLIAAHRHDIVRFINMLVFGELSHSTMKSQGTDLIPQLRTERDL